MKKCPRCELNYIKDDEQLCSVCQKEVSGQDDVAADFDLYSIVDAGNRRGKAKKEDDVLDKELEGELPTMDGYSDLMDTEIPDIDLTVDELENEDDEDEDDDEEY